LKKVVGLTLAAVLAAGLCGPVAKAEDYIVLDVNTTFSADTVYNKVEKKDEKIQKEIDQAVRQAQHLIDAFKKDMEKLEKDANGAYVNPEKYSQQAEKLNRDIEKIIKDLIGNTDKIADKMVRDAAKKGVTVINEYILIQIGDQYILVDPIRVIGG